MTPEELIRDEIRCHKQEEFVKEFLTILKKTGVQGLPSEEDALNSLAESNGYRRTEPFEYREREGKKAYKLMQAYAERAPEDLEKKSEWFEVGYSGTSPFPKSVEKWPRRAK